MTGHVWWAVLGGGWLHGQVGTCYTWLVTRRTAQVDSRGELSGDHLMYIYPDLATVLCGSFCRGVMEDARATTVQDIGGWTVQYFHTLRIF